MSAEMTLGLLKILVAHHTAIEKLSSAAPSPLKEELQQINGQAMEFFKTAFELVDQEIAHLKTRS